MFSIRSRARRRITALLASTGLAFFALQSLGDHASAAASDPYASLTGTVQLTSDILGNLGKITDEGAVDPAQTLSIGVALSRPDPAGEDAYLADVYNPASPDYRHFLSTAAWQQRFGVAADRYNRAVAWLQSGGLSTAPIAGNTEYILAQGSTAQVESLLRIGINNYRQTTTTTLFGDTTNFYANDTVPTVPANLGVLSIAGLENFSRMRSMYEIEQAAKARGLYTPDPNAPSVPAATHTGLTTPQDLWSIYDQPSNNRGAGESMAIFGWGCTEPSDGTCGSTDVTGSLRHDETTYNLPQIPIIINHYGQDPINDSGATGEWELDLPASTGMAPDADFEHLYFGNSGADPDILGAYNAWVSDPNAPRQGSSSFAGCEATPLTNSLPGGPGNPPTGPGATAVGNPNQDAYEAVLKAAVELGYTMFNSTGDLGANGCPYSFDTALNGVTPTETQINNYPSSSNYVTAVSGTVLYWTGGHGDTGPAARFLEYSWTHSGGGTSLFISAPSWQQAAGFHTNNTSAPGISFPCTTDWHTTPNAYPPGTLCKGVPDVAAQSGDVLTNGYFAGGGTSLSSPLWLGMWTRIQAASSNPGRLGFATPLLYANNANATHYEHDFFDVGGTVPAYSPGTTDDATISSCEPAPGAYSCSGSGWDYASGWGSPDVTNLMKDLDNGNTSPVAFVPAVSTPEAPVTALLAASGLGIALVMGAVRRRRILRSTTSAA
jgi:pseudomonalisin